MLHRLLQRLVIVLLVGALSPAATAETISRIRLMLHPYAAMPGQLPAEVLTKLQTIAGVPLELSATTRTGGLEFNLPQAGESIDVAALLTRLRDDRSVLWAELIFPAVSTKAKTKRAAAQQGQKLMVRVVGETPDWATLLPRWGQLIGNSMTVERQIGSVWVLKLSEAVPEEQLAALAEQLQEDPAVQYADPVRRAFAQRVPDDPKYSNQWALTDAIGGVNAPTAWDLQIGSASVTVAIVDTGITDHPDLAGRVLPGYDFVSDPPAANDGDGRDPDPSDPGDGTKDGECGDGSPGQSSFFHGTFVSGLIAANTDNGIGISGMDWNANILPVRVLGKCGGTFDDVLDGMLWAAGVPVAGVPANPHPARVINMSLGGFGSCPQSFQEAVDLAMAQGAVVVVAAGNDSVDASSFAPANCGGTITVGASTRQGDRTSYSNFGRRLDVSAPGGDGDASNQILSTSNDGQSAPGNPDYEFAVGTSFAAPYVSGTVSLMLARNSNLTPGRVLDIVTAASRNFEFGTACASGNLCGAGLLDAGLALQTTTSGSAMAPPGTVAVVEYYRADRDHYFMSADPAEIAFVDAALKNTWQRTGEVFYAWTNPLLAPPGAQSVCRFYSPLTLIDSHFYTASASECQFIVNRWLGTWLLENPAAFYVLTPDASGQCPASSLPVYRFFDNRQDANHRHTIDLTVRRAMINRAWVPEGTAASNIAFCSPI